jgi:hypothetical protein
VQNDLESLADIDLLVLQAKILKVLKERGTTRSTNNPVADYAEGLVAKALGLELVSQSNRGYDATDRRTGERYEIKSRRITSHNKSTQLGALRNLDKEPFDFLVALIFHEDFSVAYAAKIPRLVVIERSKYIAHTNSHKCMLPRSIFKDARVEDITTRLAT